MLATLGIIAALGFGPKPLPIDHLRLYRSLNVTERARVSVWMNRTDPYARGDRARVYVSTEQDAFLTVLRIDTDGRVRQASGAMADAQIASMNFFVEGVVGTLPKP